MKKFLYGDIFTWVKDCTVCTVTDQIVYLLNVSC